MAVLYVAEYETMPIVQGQFMQQADDQALLAEQTAAIGAGSVAIATAFQSRTRFVRLHTDAGCSVKFGSGTPTAIATHKRMAAGTTEYFGVPVGQSWKVAVITNP